MERYEKMRSARFEKFVIARNFFVGICNTIFGFCVYSLLIYFGFIPQIAQLIGRIVGIAFNYGTYRTWVFATGRFSVRRYIIIYFANYLFALTVLTALLRPIGNPYVAGFFTILIASATNFLGLRFFVSRPRQPVGNSDAGYRPHPIDWSFLPDWCLFLKDTCHDLFHAVAKPLIRLGPFRVLWLRLVGRDIERVVAEAGYLFTHIPKNAGTSISKQLYHRQIPHLPTAVLHERFGKRLRPYPSFAVMRHPVDRFMSAYRFTLQGGTDIVLASRFEHWRLSPLEPLDAFLDTLYARPKLMRIALQFCPQVDFVIDGDGHLITDRLFAITPQGQMPVALTDWLGLSAIPHINTTTPHATAIDTLQIQRIINLYQQDMELYERVIAAGGCLIPAHLTEQQ